MSKEVPVLDLGPFRGKAQLSTAILGRPRSRGGVGTEILGLTGNVK